MLEKIREKEPAELDALMYKFFKEEYKNEDECIKAAVKLVEKVTELYHRILIYEYMENKKRS